MFPRPIEKSSPPIQLAYKISLPIALIIWLAPLLAIFLTSIRPAIDINSGNVFGWPSDFLLFENYTAVFTQSSAGKYLWNSVLTTVPTVIISVSLACLAGYALAIYRGFKWALPLFFLFVAGNFVPFQILMVPVRDLSVRTGLYDTITGLVLFHAAFQTGFCTLFMRNFIKALPYELIESARIEGVGEFKIFWHLVLPLVRPAIAALAVLIFTFVWNDFFWATVMIQGDDRLPITAGVRALNGQFVSQWQLVSAASLLAALPPVIMFFAMQKHFIAGLTMGATKG
jgi:multiple sugar transport system permease protein